MQKNSTTTPQVNKVRIAFTGRKMTAYGGFALIASFFERIGFAEMIEKAMPIEECSPNGMGIYGKTIAFVAMVYAGSGAVLPSCLPRQQGSPREDVRARRLPDAATTLTRMFGKLKSIKSADVLSQNLWAYLSGRIPWVRSGRTGSPSTPACSPLWRAGGGAKGLQPRKARQVES